MEDKIFNFLINYFSNINDRGVDEMNNFRGDITSDEIVEWLKKVQNITSEQPSEDLEEEINLEYKSNYKLKELSLDEFRNIIHFFTQWQKQQIMKGLCLETKVYRDEEGDGIDTPIESWPALENNEITNLPNIGLKDGDKVNVIIVKEDEQ